jgi:hypothetical protein
MNRRNLLERAGAALAALFGFAAAGVAGQTKTQPAQSGGDAFDVLTRRRTPYQLVTLNVTNSHHPDDWRKFTRRVTSGLVRAVGEPGVAQVALKKDLATALRPGWGLVWAGVDAVCGGGFFTFKLVEDPLY